MTPQTSRLSLTLTCVSLTRLWHSQLLFLDSRLATAPILAIVLFFLLGHHTPRKIRSSPVLHRLIRTYITFLTMDEAEARLYPNAHSNTTNQNPIGRKRTWRMIVLGILALFEALGMVFSRDLYVFDTPKDRPLLSTCQFLVEFGHYVRRVEFLRISTAPTSEGDSTIIMTAYRFTLWQAF